MDHLYIMENIGCDLKERCDRRVATEQMTRELPPPANRLPTDMTRNVCVHINNFKTDEGLKIYNTVHSHFIACTTALYRKRKIVNTVCLQCRSRKRLHSCLHCVFFGCYDGHIQAHHSLHDHFLYVDLTYGNILCMKCGDYEYDDELADIARRNIVDASRSLGHPIPSWIPLWLSRNEIAEVQRHSKRLRLSAHTPVGLRPLINLGNTCYMNCIVQVLMHTPLLRNYLMSERHKCSNADGMCVMCEFSQLFQEFYCGARGLLAPHRLLYLMWSHAPHLAGGTQQDAQEFFMAILDMLHKNCVHSILSGNPNSQNPDDVYTLDERNDQLDMRNGEDSFSKCQSIIKQIFMGKFQSDLVCKNCQGVSSRIDPFWDIQLDLGPTPDGSSLLDCLQRFTSSEELGLENKIMCNTCNTIHEATKQLTVKKIPIVASIQLKRFKHDSSNTKSNIPLNKKVSTYISFPEVLDMSPFMTKPHNISETNVFTPFDNRYILFGVINHQGKLDAGHYTAYVRLQPNFWYKCDDHKITRAPLKEVLDSEGYLLFYHKRTLEYV